MQTWHIILSFMSTAWIGIYLQWALRNRERWRYVVAPISYCLHVIAFYSVAGMGWLSPTVLNYWSNAIRLHSLLLVGGTGILLLYIGRGLWTNHK